MAQIHLSSGASDGDGTGTKGRVLTQDLEAMFSELYGFPVIANTRLAPAAITAASTNDYTPGGGFPNFISRLDLNPNTVNSVLTGLLAGVDGQQVLIRNIGTFTLTLNISSGSSQAANRFLGLGTALALPPGARTFAVYYTSPATGWSIG